MYIHIHIYVCIYIYIFEFHEVMPGRQINISAINMYQIVPVYMYAYICTCVYVCVHV